jgi:hypothetical protein
MIVNETASTSSTWKEKARMGREAYEAPELKVLGTLQELTQENFENNNVDYNFGGLVLDGTS